MKHNNATRQQFCEKQLFNKQDKVRMPERRSVRRCSLRPMLIWMAIIAIPGISVVVASKYETAYACEGKVLTLECEAGNIINLIRANYGRFSITICNDHGNVDWSVNCMSPKSLRVLHAKCALKPRCSVMASTSLFGDPCPNTHKYLEAHYQCISATQTSTTTGRPPPPWLSTSPASFWTSSTAITPLSQAPSSDQLTTLDSSTTTTTLSNLLDSPNSTAPATVYFSSSSSSTTSRLPSTSTETVTGATEVPVTVGSINRVMDSTPKMAFDEVTYMNAHRSNVFCGPTTERNLFWNVTRVGEVNVQPCPGGATGLAKWRCVLRDAESATSSWQPSTPDLAQCRSLWLNNLEIRVNMRDSSIISIANDLSQVTSSKTLYGGDMLVTTKIIQTMTDKMAYDVETFPDQKQREAIVYELLHGVVKTGSNLLDESQEMSWHDLSFEDQMRVATSLLTGLEDNAFLLAETIIREKSVVQRVKNILLCIRVIETRNIAPTEVFPKVDHEKWSVSDDVIELPRAALVENSEGGLVRIVFLAFDRLESILSPPAMEATQRLSLAIDNKSNSSTIGRNSVLNSKVISASLGKGRHIQLSQPVRLTLQHIKTKNLSQPICVFWSYIDRAWSKDGCHVESTNVTHTVCLCNHLTNFALLMDVVPTTTAEVNASMGRNVRIMIGISISLCIVFIVIALAICKLYNGQFLKINQ